jgi:MFS family permease
MAATARSVSHIRITSLAGKICGSILLSVFADRFGRKRILLVSIFLSTVLSFLILAFQSFKQYLVLNMLTSALTQSALICTYVLLFELIFDRRKQNIFCSLFISTSYLLSVVIGLMFSLSRNWFVSHLSGSLLALLAFGYPW